MNIQWNICMIICRGLNRADTSSIWRRWHGTYTTGSLQDAYRSLDREIYLV